MSQRVPNENNEALEPEVGLEQKLTAAIYARQSRVRNIAYSSCQSQIDMCWQLAANNNWNVTHVFSDEGRSSETLDRPQLTQLIAAIETGQFQFVIVYSIDRLTRRLLHFQYLLEVFDKHNVKIAVVNGPSYSDDANGWLMANIVAAVSEFQQEMTRERMSDMRAA